jgi:hypothetical protein
MEKTRFPAVSTAWAHGKNPPVLSVMQSGTTPKIVSLENAKPTRQFSDKILDFFPYFSQLSAHLLRVTDAKSNLP